MNVESPFFTMNHDLEENVEEEIFSDPTIPLMNVVEECLSTNDEALISLFVQRATTKKNNNTSKRVDKRCKQKKLIF